MRQKSLIVYFILAYFFSWIAFVLLALNHHNIIFLFPDDAAHARTQDIWHAFGGLGPALGAILTLKIFFDKNYFKGYLQSYSSKKLTFSGWVISLSPFLIFLFAIIVNRIIKNEWFNVSDFFRENYLLAPVNFLAWFLPLVTYGFGEEAGWRGFALPCLQNKYSAFTATSILSVFWIGWHIPSFFYRYDLSGGMLIGFIIGVFAGAIWLTFIFNYTKGSLLAVSIWHFTWNTVSMIGKTGMIAAIMSTLIMVLAVFVVWKYKGTNLSPYNKAILHSEIIH
jgi:membrane protease YdiL (CAAX protease family)